MSNKERVLQLVDDIDDNRLVFVVNLLEALEGYAGEEIEPDEWDLQMIAESEKENDGTTISIGELAIEIK